MSTSIRMPGLPLGGAPITICRWLKQPGDHLAAGEPLLIALNDRVEVALPAPHAGLLETLLAVEGDAVAAGAEIARLAGASAPPAAPRRIISPLARRVASDLQVDLAMLTGSGPGGRIHKPDVLRAASLRPADNPPPLVAALPPLVAVCANGSAVPYALTAVELDCSALLAYLAASQHAALDLTACIAYATVAELLAHPLLNSTWHPDYIVARRRVHLAVARPSLSMPGPLPAVRDAQDLNVYGMARALARLAQPAATPVQDYTFALIASDLPGWTTARAPWLHSAHLCIGAVQSCPRVVDERGAERLAIRPVALLTLSYDARLHDQPAADAFLVAVQRRLERFGTRGERREARG